MQVTLIAQHRGRDQRRIWLTAGQSLTVGRTQAADHTFSHDPKISSRHFRLECTSERCRIVDLDSTNGTVVNDQRIEQADLRDGDIIRVGDTQFRVEIVARRPSSVDTSQLVRDTHTSQPTGPSTPSHAAKDSSQAPPVPTPGAVPPKETATPVSPPPETIRTLVDIPPTATPHRAPRLYVTAQLGDNKQRRIWLKPPQSVTIGRSAACDFAIPSDAHMAPAHFRIRWAENAWLLEQLPGEQQTLVNGQREAQATITSETTVLAGNTVFALSVSDAASPTASPHQPSTSPFDQQTHASGLLSVEPRLTAPCRDFPSLAKALQRSANDVFWCIVAPSFAAAKQRLHPLYLYDWLPAWHAPTVSPVILTDPVDSQVLPQLCASSEVVCVLLDATLKSDALPHLRAAARGQDRLSAPPDIHHMISMIPISSWPRLLAETEPTFVRFMFGPLQGMLFPQENGQRWYALGNEAFAQLIQTLVTDSLDS